MREVKFRVWNSSISVLANVIEIRFNQNSILTDDSKFLWDLNKAVLEQYTGLKDFNGIEICVGDILQDVDDSTIVGVVEYDEAFGEYDCGDNNLYECTRDCVVIGNIHENADLLNDTDRIGPDDIGNDIHEFLHGGDK